MKRDIIEELKYKLAILESSIILDLKFDIPYNRITLFIKTIDGKITYSEIVINMVSGFIFMNDIEINRKHFYEYKPGDILELSEIGLIEEDVEIMFKSEVDVKFYRQFKSGANIYIEMGTRFLFIEAGEIIINGESYILNY